MELPYTRRKILSQSAAVFIRCLIRKYNSLLVDVYDPDNAVTLKSNCVKCRANRNHAYFCKDRAVFNFLS